jgi:hypothetical protein
MPSASIAEIVIAPAATNATGFAPTIVMSPTVTLAPANTRIGGADGCDTSVESTAIDWLFEPRTDPSSVLIVDPEGMLIAAALAETASAGPSPFDATTVLQVAAGSSQPVEHIVVVTDMPSSLQTVNVPSLPHVAAPAVQPQTSTGQSVGVIVQTSLSPPDAGNEPSTSQNGYAGSVQSALVSHWSCFFVHAAINSKTIASFRM